MREPRRLTRAREIERRKDLHADVQIAYRKRLKEKRAPDREDFGRAALLLILLIFDRQPASSLARWFYDALTVELAQDGFDGHQIRKRFSDMVDRVHENRKARERIRELKRDREADDAA